MYEVDLSVVNLVADSCNWAEIIFSAKFVSYLKINSKDTLAQNKQKQQIFE